MSFGIWELDSLDLGYWRRNRCMAEVRQPRLWSLMMVKEEEFDCTSYALLLYWLSGEDELLAIRILTKFSLYDFQMHTLNLSAQLDVLILVTNFRSRKPYLGTLLASNVHHSSVDTFQEQVIPGPLLRVLYDSGMLLFISTVADFLVNLLDTLCHQRTIRGFGTSLSSWSLASS